jgi:hypothetical protein
MSFLLILEWAIIFGALWGCLQGMIMIQPEDKMAVNPAAERSLLGVRCHVWFRHYHLLWIACMLAFAVFVILSFIIVPEITGFRRINFCLGVCLLGWEASELMYSFARYRRWICGRENIVIADLVAWHPERVWSHLVHGLRIGAGGMLFIVAALVQ